MHQLMNKVLIETSEDFYSLVSSICWDDAFIKESHLLSPSYINNEYLVAANAQPSAKLLICTPDSEYSGIELLFENIEEFYLSVNMDVEPSASFFDSGFEFKFLPEDSRVIKARRLWYRYRNSEDFGFGTQICGDYFDEGGCLDQNNW